MKELCKVASCLVLSLGILGSFFAAYAAGITLNYMTAKAERNWPETLTIFFAILMSTLVLSIILYAISELLGNLERILGMLSQNNDAPQKSVLDGIVFPSLSHASSVESHKTAAINPPVQNDFSSNAQWEKYNSWKCPKCGRINDNTADVCFCGSSKGKDK